MFIMTLKGDVGIGKRVITSSDKDHFSFKGGDFFFRIEVSEASKAYHYGLGC